MTELFEPLSDEEVWAQSKWLIDEMQDGMSLYEGYIFSIPVNSIAQAIDELVARVGPLDTTNCVWRDCVSDCESISSYSHDDIIALYLAGQIYTLTLDYSLRTGEVELYFRLLFDPAGNECTDLDAICYRDGLKPWHQAQLRFTAALQHQRYLKRLFRGQALFIGPDSSNRPDWPNTTPSEWVRAE